MNNCTPSLSDRSHTYLKAITNTQDQIQMLLLSFSMLSLENQIFKGFTKS